MKTLKHLSKTMPQMIFLTFMLAIFSCGSTQNTDTTLDSRNPDGTPNTSVLDGTMDTRNIDRTTNSLNRGDAMDLDDRRGTMGTSNRGDSMESQYENSYKSDNQKDQEMNRQFLVSAAETNLKQIQAGQLAQQNGQADHVRELGKMLEDAHTQSQQELTTLAEGKMISLPSSIDENSQEDFNDLMNESDDDFDKSYTDMMVSVHEDSIEAFEQASNDSKDSDIKKWATATLPNLRKHLNKSRECQTKLSEMTLSKN